MVTSVRYVLLLLLCAFNAGVIPVAQATPGQPGSLDPTWAAASALGAGKVATAIGTFAQTNVVAVQPDGKVVLAGLCFDAGKANFCALRYRVDGTLDTGFAGSGSVITPVLTGAGASYDVANAIALQPDGKIVLAGACFDGNITMFCAVRYMSDGSLDSGFGNSGRLVTSMTAFDSTATAVAVLTDGRVLLAGTCPGASSPASFCLARHLPNGVLDSASGFGTGGKVFTPMGTAAPLTTANVTAMAVQPDGKVLVAGYCGPTISTNNDFCMLRYLSTGVLDTTWGAASAFGAGKVKTAVGTGDDQATAIALQPDGKVLLAGKCSNGTNFDFCALRYQADGIVDISFGSNGVVITPIGADTDAATAMALQPDGKVLVAGSCKAGVKTNFCMLRYSASGVLDVSFGSVGSGGKVTTALTVGNDFANALSLTYDGKVVLAGYCDTGNGPKFCAARYDGELFSTNHCSLDIDGDGSVLGTTDSLIHARIALGIRGDAVVSGISFASTATRTSWPLIRDYLIARCGMTLPQ